MPGNPLQHDDDLRSRKVIRKVENDDSATLIGWVTPDIEKIQVSSQQRSSGLTRSLCNLGIRSSRHPDILRKLNVMTACHWGADRRRRQIGVDQRVHTELNGGRG